MADRPILFSAPMVRALIDGRKTQTRRIMKVQPPEWATYYEQPHMLNILGHWVPSGLWRWSEPEKSPPAPLRQWPVDAAGDHYWLRPKFAAGDRMWVKETWRVSPDACEGWNPNDARPVGWIDYRARGSEERSAPDFDAVCRATFGKSGEIDWDCVPSLWRPSIFMPRWASRLTLTVTGVRVERLQDCSEADAIAEGIEGFACIGGNAWRDYGGGDGFNVRDPGNPAQRSYATLWNYINGDGAWEANPWVVAVSFDVTKGNIDG